MNGREVGGESPEGKKFEVSLIKPTKEQLKEFFTALELHYDDPSGESNYDDLNDKQKKEIQFMMKTAEKSKNVKYYVIRDQGRIIATGSLEVKLSKDKHKFGYLSDLTVHPSFRNRGLAKMIANERVQQATKEGCEYVQADVLVENIPALLSKMRDGFCITYVNSEIVFSTKIRKYTDFILGKDLKSTGVPYNQEQIVNLSDLKQIWKLLVRGWDGVDIQKNESWKEEEKDDPKNYNLILKKR
jgi:GNAT superfamily N-acetyltransferase